LVEGRKETAVAQSQDAALAAAEAANETCRCCLGTDEAEPVFLWPELNGLWAHPSCLSEEARLAVLAAA